MTKNEKLHADFLAAVDLVNNLTHPLPPDLLLKLYAYYKIANENFAHPGSKTPLVNAFKANALFQAQHVGKEEAMQKYIVLVQQEILSKEN
ncbi:acyl-CoA-binding protein [Arenibacter sp. GZD96]|uniref:acyl-CoA-binding protein n=1 Tax=Aurantibrevibacter litoralis TaxID=3106030 RepID=UPI002AFF18F8|nr:acyl-CoA-binding protein [Arenibacter sp. GZD-96]MEA1786856.1 acyl-CoA-binding protein [Arenibacter sp. GZD-96]